MRVYSVIDCASAPVTDNDLTNKLYVDTLASGKSNVGHTHEALTNGYNASVPALTADTYILTQEKILAPFDSTETYSPDDYVTYQGKVYKCTDNHTGAWNASNFVATTLDEYIQKHKHSVLYLDGVQSTLDYSVADDYPNDLPTCGAVYDFVMSGVNAFLGMGVYTKIKTASTPTIALADDTAIYQYTIAADTTLVFDVSGLTSTTDKAVTFELYLTMPSTAYTLTFPSNVSWLNNEIPSMSTPSKTYMLVFRSLDGGTTWLGSKEGAY